MSGEVERARETRRFHRDAASPSTREGRLRGLCRSGSRRTLVAALFLLVASPGALSGPVEVYREGDRYCPRNLPPSSSRIDAAEAGRIALRLVPDRFCGPTDAIGGCDLVTENFYDSWRVYVHQYRRIPNAHDWSALTHSYVILDAVGNCIANIPGTEPGAPR
ncbi:MAG TPA: hypothetical protein VFQ55_06355 [Casimicrobiaceae bacterium]|jgi:hypothetical protein|nr:hypothetical protein [Casimicrobiaceae bacterium]